MAKRSDVDLREGMDVLDNAGEKLGTISEIAQGSGSSARDTDYLRVKSGFLGLGSDLYVPLSAVQEVKASGVYLSVAKSEIKSQRWDAPPTGGSTARTDAAQTVPLRAEELQAKKTPVQAGEVEIRKEVVTEQKTLEVPVTREEVVVERHAVDPRPSDRPIGEGETLRVPVRGEEVDVQKQTVVTEEVEVGKRTVQDTERAEGTVRREELRVDKAGQVQSNDERRNPPPAKR